MATVTVFTSDSLRHRALIKILAKEFYFINAIIETQKGNVVFVLKDGDVVEERFVDVLGGNDFMVQVEGLSFGEKIITKGNYDLIDGEKVNVTGEYKYVSGEEGS